VKPKPAHPDDFRTISWRVLNNDESGLWVETIILAGVRQELAKLVRTLPRGARVMKGRKAKQLIRQALDRCQEGCQS
jgi:hypothetical protein